MKGYYAVIIAALAVVVAGVVPEREFEFSDTARLPHPKECTQYYVCQDGKCTIYECPDGLHFNNAIKQCDWPTLSECFSGIRWPETQPNIPEKEEEEEQEEANQPGCFGTCPIPDPKDKTIFLPYRDDCTKFCSCSNGNSIVMSCPGGLHFDIKRQVCNWPQRVNCQW